MSLTSDNYAMKISGKHVKLIVQEAYVATVLTSPRTTTYNNHTVVENKQEIQYAIWLSENTHFGNPGAITLIKTGRLYYNDTPGDMQNLFQIYMQSRTIRDFIRRNFAE